MFYASSGIIFILMFYRFHNIDISTTVIPELA